MYSEHFKTTCFLTIFVTHFLFLTQTYAADISGVTGLTCEFQGGVGLKSSDEIFTPKKESERFTLRIPSGWLSKTPPIHAVSETSWTNLNYGWSGDSITVLNGRMIAVVESTSSDNSMYFHVWLDDPRIEKMQALYFVAGHARLPIEYQLPRLSNGICHIQL